MPKKFKTANTIAQQRRASAARDKMMKRDPWAQYTKQDEMIALLRHMAYVLVLILQQTDGNEALFQFETLNQIRVAP